VSWIETTLGESFELYQPKTITTKDLKDDGKYFVYGANGIIGKYDKYNHEEPQLLVTCRGATCGAVNVSQPFSWINGNAMVVKPLKKDIDVRFIEYFFRGAVDLSRAITGTAQPQITRQSLSPIVFKYPPLATQQKIVSKLDAIFAEIDKATVAAETNAKNAKALFQSYVRRLLSETDEFKIVELGKLCEVKTGKKDVNEGSLSGAYPFFTCASKHTYSEVYSFDCEAILIAGNGAVGQTSYYKGKFEAYQRTYVLTNFNQILPHYLLYVLNNRLMNELSSKVLGNTIPYIKKGMLTDFLVPLPSIEKQRLFVAKLDTISSNVQKSAHSYSTKVNELSSLKQSILKQAFSGELVKE
jgi:type I restriction enzyme, S subunit